MCPTVWSDKKVIIIKTVGSHTPSRMNGCASKLPPSSSMWLTTASRLCNAEPGLASSSARATGTTGVYALPTSDSSLQQTSDSASVVAAVVSSLARCYYFPNVSLSEYERLTCDRRHGPFPSHTRSSGRSRRDEVSSFCTILHASGVGVSTPVSTRTLSHASKA